MSKAGYQFRSSYCSKDEIRLIGPYVVDEKLIRGAPKYFVQHSSEYGSFGHVLKASVLQHLEHRPFITS